MNKFAALILPLAGLALLNGPDKSLVQGPAGALRFGAAHSSHPDTTESKRPDFVKEKLVIVWQPSHQTNTGKDFSEAAVCNGIVEAAMKTRPNLKEYKVWSLGRKGLHHPDVGSNTMIEHTSAVIDEKISGYAWELRAANKRDPQVFISVHNNGGTNRHAIWGYIHEGDAYEAENRELAARLIKAISEVTDLQNRGVLLDSSTGRNDYRCSSTNKQAFYSLDEHVNKAPYRVLLEIGDNALSKVFLENPANQTKMGEALKKELMLWLAEKQNGKFSVVKFSGRGWDSKAYHSTALHNASVDQLICLSTQCSQ